jgi:hypothetical protein
MESSGAAVLEVWRRVLGCGLYALVQHPPAGLRANLGAEDHDAGHMRLVAQRLVVA